MKRPVFVGAVFVCVCDVIAYYHTGSIWLVYALILIAAALFLFMCDFKTALFVLISVIAVGNLANLQAQIKENDKFSGDRMTLDFVAVEDIKYYEDYGSLAVRTVTEKGIGKNRKLTLFGDFQKHIEAGDIFRAEIKVRSVANDENKLYYYSNDCYMKANLLSYVMMLGENRFYSVIGQVRRYITKTVDNCFSDDRAALIKGIVLGDKTDMSEDLRENITRSGVNHVVVVSGMHLAIIMAGIFTVLDRLFYNRFMRAAFTIAVIVMLSALCGFTMSIMRAGLMYVVVTFALFFDRDADSLSALSLTVIVILLFSPFAIFNTSFQLSVLATFAVVAVSPFYAKLIKEKFGIKNKISCTLIDTSFTTFFATVFTMPVTVYVFGGVSLVAVITNLLISYVVTWMLLLVFAALVINTVDFISVLSVPLFFAADIICRYTLFAINTLGSLKYAYINCSKAVSFAAAGVAVLLFAFSELYYTVKLKKFKGSKINGSTL